MPIGISATSWRPIPAKNHGRSENQAPAGRRICRPKSVRRLPVPLRRATIASQAMMAKFCAQMRTMSVFGPVRVVGIHHEHPGDHRHRDAHREGGDDVADAPAHPAACPGDRRR